MQFGPTSRSLHTGKARSTIAGTPLSPEELRRIDAYWLLHRLTYRRPCQHNIYVRGYKEQGNINTPLELAIRNQTDRFSLAIDAIDRMSRVGSDRSEPDSCEGTDSPSCVL